MLEFSDFQCPFCGRYVRDTYPKISSDYVDSGKVKYAFKHYPIESIHPLAKNAALAAVCSDAQGKFWEMHDRLFADQSAIDLPTLLTLARPIGLNDTKYRSCLTGQEGNSTLATDKADSLKAEFSGTPAFLIGRVGADGVLHATRRVVGAQPFSVFQRALDEVIAGR